MFEHTAQVAKQQLRLLTMLVKDIDDAHYTQPIGGAKNPPAFILCHLCVSTDFLLSRLGKPTYCPANWRENFGPTCSPEKVAIPYPPKAEVMAILERALLAACAASAEVTPEFAAKPHGIPFLAGSPVETNGDFITLLLASHPAFHAGQLSVMRRQLGFAHLF
ncbi:MAG: DinB family protein [Planctomycetaceae bacterium]|nr:DinB family protein [Planctomycetaceae bacterium]